MKPYEPGDKFEIITIPKGELVCELPLMQRKERRRASSSRAGWWVALLALAGVLAIGVWFVGG